MRALSEKVSASDWAGTAAHQSAVQRRSGDVKVRNQPRRDPGWMGNEGKASYSSSRS
jgi:hypothetical protein